MKLHHPQFKNQSLTTVWGEHKVDDYGHVHVPHEEAQQFFQKTLNFREVKDQKTQPPIQTVPPSAPLVGENVKEQAPLVPPAPEPPKDEDKVEEPKEDAKPSDEDKKPAVDEDGDEPTMSADEVLQLEDEEEEVAEDGEDEAPAEEAPKEEEKPASRFGRKGKRGRK